MMSQILVHLSDELQNTASSSTAQLFLLQTSDDSQAEKFHLLFFCTLV